jgi:2'-5' RNA ligase
MAETALVVLVPELEPLIGAWRRDHTSDGACGMPPHVTLIYPFADSSEVGPYLPELAEELGRFSPFELAFRGTRRFPETLYLEPEPAEPFVAMTQALASAFPDFPPYGGQLDEIVPHASIAQGGEPLFARVEDEVVPRLPVSVRVERAWLMEDTSAGWRRHTAFPLNRRERV